MGHRNTLKTVCRQQGLPAALSCLQEAKRRAGPERCRLAASSLVHQPGAVCETLSLLEIYLCDRYIEFALPAADLLAVLGRAVGLVGRNLTYRTFEDIMRVVLDTVEGEADEERVLEAITAVLAKYDDRFGG